MKIIKKLFHFLVGLIRFLIWLVILFVVLIILFQRVFDNKIGLGNYRIFTIASGSMIPEYNIYDVILVEAVPIEQIKSGDDLVYLGVRGSFKDKIITHRVENVTEENGEIAFLTKGINNENSDPIVYASQVYGIVRYKSITLSFLSKLLNNDYGFYFLIFLPISILIFLEILDWIKGKEEKIEEEEQQEEVLLSEEKGKSDGEESHFEI